MTSRRSYGYGVLEQSGAGPRSQCFCRRSVDDGSRSLISLMRIITQTVAVLRYSSASAITVERSTTTAHSDASWQHCSQTTGACLATMAPSLPGGHRRTASSAAVRRLWQQRCLHRTAARPLALPSRQRCVHCCATRSAGAALALHQGSARASGASGQRQRPRDAARGHTHSKIERESDRRRGLRVSRECRKRNFRFRGDTHDTSTLQTS